MTIQTYQATTSIGTAFTSVGNTAVTFMSFCNYSVSDITANVFVVPYGDTADTTTIVLQNLPLNASDTYQLYLGAEKLILGDGDTVQVISNTATALNVVTSYTNI